MPTNYGTKKMIYEKRPSGEQHPLFVLVDKVENPRGWHIKSTASKCYCADCRKVFDIDTMNIDIEDMRRDSLAIRASATTTQQDIACPECGNTGKYAFIRAQDQQSADSEEIPVDDKTNEHINYDGAWRIPASVQGRYVFEFRDDNGNLTRLDDNAMEEYSVVFPSGKVFTWETEFSQTTDLINHRILSYRTRIDGRGRTPIGPAEDLANPFHYADDVSFNIASRIDVRDVRLVDRLYYNRGNIIGADSVFEKAFTEKDRCSLSFVEDKSQEHTDDLPFDDVLSSSLDEEPANPNIVSIKRPRWRETFLFSGCTEEELSEMSKETSRIKSRAVFEALASKLPHPVYSDLVQNGLNLKEHKKGVTEDDVDPNNVLQSMHYYMCVRYPAAVEYAASRAELRVQNYEFAEKRKVNDDPDYVPKTATDSARAKFFREEMNVVAEQLCACDDKVLNEIRAAGTNGPTYVFSKDETGKGSIKKVDHYVSPESDNPSAMQIMQDRLSFFVYGLRDGYPVPSDIAIKLKDAKTLQEATQSTKKLKSAFKMEPIATASNVYTLQKWKISDPNHVKSVLDLINEQSPVVNPGEYRVKGQRQKISRKYSEFVNAGVLTPVRDKTVLRFIRLYGQTHDTTSMINEILDNREDMTSHGWAKKWNAFTEAISLYEPIINNPNVTVIQTKKDLPTGETNAEMSEDKLHELRKNQLRVYIENSTGKNIIQTAYRDFSTIYGEKTVETINALAREIKKDMEMDKIKLCAEQEGMEAALVKYEQALSAYENPTEAIEQHKPFADRKYILATRNGKPLFERNLDEIHDELSEMSRKNVTTNEHIQLTKEQQEMNETVEVDLSKLPKSQWIENPPEVPEGTMGNFSFTVLDDKYAYIRVASDLLNCVAGGSYFDSAKRGNTVIAAMRNENGQTVACIELKKQSPDDLGRCWRVNQFQGYRDGVVDRRYYDAFVKWCSDHKIEYESSNNVKRCRDGEKDYFYGNGNADFHTSEYDPVLDLALDNTKAAQKRQERITKAIELYGGDIESGPNLPAAPDDLQSFS